MPAVIAPASAPLAWASLNVLTKRRYDWLLAEYGDLERAWSRLDAALLRRIGCKKEETIARVLGEAARLKTEEAAEMLDVRGIRLLTIADADYPRALRTIADPPIFLFAWGALDILEKPCIALVGTRSMSAYGKRVTEEITADLVRAGITTVSGLAAGIDSEVARITLREGGETVAVLGHGFGLLSPRNRKFAEEIVAGGGLLLTEYPFATPPDHYTFPARNRIIAGLALGTVVLEAASQSGSLITASLALEDGRDVFAVPGQIFDQNYDGAHELIAKGGAKLIRSAADILRDLGVVVPEDGTTSAYRAQTPDEQTILQHLSSMPQSADDLMEKSGLSASTANATLTLMEIKGGVKNLGAGQWVKA